MILPAGLVTWLAFLLFDIGLQGGDDFLGLVESLSSDGSEARGKAVLREARARFGWLAGAILFLVTGVAVALYCGWMTFRTGDRQRRVVMALVSVLLCAAGIGYFALAQA